MSSPNNRSPPPTNNSSSRQSPSSSSSPMFNNFLIYSWLVAQIATTLFTILYLVGNPSLYYKALLASAIVYSIPIFKSNEGKKPSKELAMQLIQKENTQLILYCILFYFLSTPSVLYLVPNFIYSFYHLLNKVLPLSSRVPFIHSLLQKLKSNQEKARAFAVSIEVNTFVFLLFGIFTSGIYGIMLVVLYLRYLKIRYIYSPVVKQRVVEIDMMVNQLQANEKCPQFVRNIIPKIKYYISL